MYSIFMLSLVLYMILVEPSTVFPIYYIYCFINHNNLLYLFLKSRRNIQDFESISLFNIKLSNSKSIIYTLSLVKFIIFFCINIFKYIHLFAEFLRIPPKFDWFSAVTLLGSNFINFFYSTFLSGLRAPLVSPSIFI